MRKRCGLFHVTRGAAPASALLHMPCAQFDQSASLLERDPDISNAIFPQLMTAR